MTTASRLQREQVDVVVVGAGAAGLSGALALARSRRSVLVVDAGDPRNAPAEHVHNLVSRDGTPAAEIYARGREEVTGYGGRVERAQVSAIRRLDHGPHGFAVDVDGRTVRARRVLVATGVRDELPELPGLRQRWGRDVLHCPYCHGWEVRDQRVGVLATGPVAVHQALLFRQLSDRVTLFQHTVPALDEERLEELDAVGIRCVAGAVTRVDATGDRLSGVVVDGRTHPLDALVVAPVAAARAELLAPLGLAPVEVLRDGHLVGTRIEADATGATAVPGLRVAGNLSDPQAQVVTSAAQGLVAGAALNADLVAEDLARAVEARRYESAFGEQAWDERYGAHVHPWSGGPNPTVVGETADLTPGRALDVGAGEGGDACWLAQRGWQVTGVDVSAVALERAAARSAAAGLDVTWLKADVTKEPLPGRFDLVTAHFLHLLPEPRRQLLARLADAVVPGGTLLVVGHGGGDVAGNPAGDPVGNRTPTAAAPAPAEAGWTLEEVAGSLGPGWTVEVAQSRPRPATDVAGHAGPTHDAVLRARRRTP